jgi:hypothetical protein
VDEIPSATSYSPLSFGRVKLLSNEDVNILKANKEKMKLTLAATTIKLIKPEL